MRKCLRCESVMVDGLELIVSGGSYDIDIREKRII